MDSTDPIIGSHWRNDAGILYSVFCIANKNSNKKDFPRAVVFQNVITGAFLACEVGEFYQSMTISEIQQ